MKGPQSSYIFFLLSLTPSRSQNTPVVVLVLEKV